MSNTDNIYNILNNFNKIAKEEPAPVAAPKAKTKLQESMEQVVNEKYMGFKKTVAAIKKGGSAEDPEAVAAAIGRKKYGKKEFQKAAAAGKKLGEGQSATTYTVAYKDPKKPGKSHSTQVKATSAAEAKAAFQKWDTTDRFTYLGSRPDVDKVYEDQGVTEDDLPDYQRRNKEFDGLGGQGAPDHLNDLSRPAKAAPSYIKQQLKARRAKGGVAGPKGHLPEQGVAEGSENSEYDQLVSTVVNDYIQKMQAAGLGTPDRPRGKPSTDVILKAKNLGVELVQLQNDIISKYQSTVRQDMAEASFPTVADARKRAEQEKGTGKFTSKKNPDNPSGTIYTRKYNPKSGETDDTEKREPGRPKKSAFEDMSTIDKMIAESFGELFEGTSRPINDPVSKAAPTAPGVGSGIRVTPMPALATSKPATTAKPAPAMGSIQGGVWTAKPPKAGEQGVPVPQGLDEVDAEMEGAGPTHSSLKDPVAAAKYDLFMQQRKNDAAAMIAKIKPPMAKEAEELDEVDAEMEGMRKLAGLKGGQKKLDRDHDGELTRKDFSMLRKGLEEGGRDDYDEIRDKIQWLQGAPNYLSRDEAKETAYYTKDTDPVWDGYRDDTDEVGENLEVRANPAGASSAEQAKKIGAQFPQQNGKEPNLAYKIGEDEVEENLVVVPNPSGAGSVAAAKKLGAMMPAKPGEKDPISTNEDDMEEGGAFGLAVTNAKKDGIQPGETFKVGGKEYDLKEGDAALNQMRRIAGLKECGMSPVSVGAAEMHDEQGNMNISTSQNSSGSKSVTITADGDAASSLMQMLKLAGMGGDGAAPAAAAEPEIVVVAQDGEEAMEEEKDPRYQASTTPDEQVAPVQALTKGGNGDVAGQEKVMKPGGYQFGDNNLAMQESLSTQLMKEYNSIKIKK